MLRHDAPRKNEMRELNSSGFFKLSHRIVNPAQQVEGFNELQNSQILTG